MISISCRVVPITLEEIESLTERIQGDASFKGALARSEIKFRYQNMERTKAEKLVTCKEIVSTVPIVIYTKKNFILLEAMNAKIENLKSAGLIHYWRWKFLSRSVRSRKSSQQKVLTIHQLLGSFEVLIIGLAIGIIIFLVEIKCQ